MPGADGAPTIPPRRLEVELLLPPLALPALGQLLAKWPVCEMNVYEIYDNREDILAYLITTIARNVSKISRALL